jgi:hypothetical protein
MDPALHICLILTGTLALAASLLLKKKAGWFALVGSGLLVPLAVRDADPVLALGVMVLLVVRWLPRSPASAKDPEPVAQLPAGPPDQAP